MSNDRRCSGCNQNGHNIRSCIKQLNETIILEYSTRIFNHISTEFLSGIIPSDNKLKKLCQNYGLAINVTNNIKIERLHNIYMHLGRLHRQNTINENYLRTRMRIINGIRPRLNIYRPSYLPVRNDENEHVRRRITNNRQLGIYSILTRLQYEPPLIRQPSIQIIVDKTKFIENTDICECPICYEECHNAIITDCNHLFCQSCTSKLINNINTNKLPCPLCRTNINNVFVFSETSSELMLKL
jgi:hypothetical protein